MEEVVKIKHFSNWKIDEILYVNDQLNSALKDTVVIRPHLPFMIIYKYWSPWVNHILMKYNKKYELKCFWRKYLKTFKNRCYNKNRCCHQTYHSFD